MTGRSSGASDGKPVSPKTRTVELANNADLRGKDIEPPAPPINGVPPLPPVSFPFPPLFTTAGPGPGFAVIDGDLPRPGADGTEAGLNATAADLIAVPCPGADAVETWERAALRLLEKQREAQMNPPPPVTHSQTQQEGQHLLSAGTATLAAANAVGPESWVRGGIRNADSRARVLLYRHRDLTGLEDGGEGLLGGLDDLANDLLQTVVQLMDQARAHAEQYESRQGSASSTSAAGAVRTRPMFFVCHGIGGLVFKRMLVTASRTAEYHKVLWNCHGVTFFGTPHRGSSYLSMHNMAESIQALLHLQAPLPRVITESLRLNDRDLLGLHDEFTVIASELRLWTFYEIVDSQLSGPGGSSGLGLLREEVKFGAPLVSIKSSLLGVRQEEVFAVEGDHAECASFGPGNEQTLTTYLAELAAAVDLAIELTNRSAHHPLDLKSKVRMELIGFYEDPETSDNTSMGSSRNAGDIRLYRTDYKLHKFLEKGPERCLEERLTKAVGPVHVTVANQAASPTSGGSGSPSIPSASRMGSLVPSFLQNRPASRASATSTVSEPQEQLPGRVVDTDQTAAESSAEKPKLHAAATEPIPGPLGVMDGSKRTISSPENSEGRRIMKEDSALRHLAAGFSRPDPTKRKFMWMHLPYNNPTWVKSVFETIGKTTNQSFDHVLNQHHWYSKHVHGRHSQIQASYVKPACVLVQSPSSIGRASPLLGATMPNAAGTNNRKAAPMFMSSFPAPSPSPSPAAPSAPTCLYLYMPYLNFDRYKTVLSRRNLVRERTFRGRARPVPKRIADLDSMEMRVVWEYLQYDPPLNCRRTLDQFGYPSLRDTYARDDDQMLYKLTKEDDKGVGRGGAAGGANGRKPDTTASVRPSRPPTQNGTGTLGTGLDDVYQPDFMFPQRTFSSKFQDEDATKDSSGEPVTHEHGPIKDGKILMVDQLWLWAIDTESLVTFFPKRESHAKEGPLFQQADLRNSVYNELNGDLTGRCENALDLAAFIVLHAVTVLLNRSSHPDLEIFRIFEEAISTLTDRLTSAMKRFRMQSFKGDAQAMAATEDLSTRSIRERHRLELAAAEQENRDNTSALLELRDLEDELSTLLKLFEAQEACIHSLRDVLLSPSPASSGPADSTPFLGDDSLRAKTANGQFYLEAALAELEGYKAQTHEMLARASVTRADYEKLLEMVQRQAQVDEVRWSRLQTELASAQNLSVMIFTVFTVIFLPLTFFTGLFGMNTSDWAGTQDGSQFLPLSTIGAIALPASAVLIIVSLSAAFSSRVQSFILSFLRVFGVVSETAEHWLKAVTPRPVREWMAGRRKRRNEARRREEEAEGGRKKGAWDSWEEWGRQRGSVYTVPEQNHKVATMYEAAEAARKVIKRR